MKKLSLFALLLAASTFSSLAAADVVGGGSSGTCGDRPVRCRALIVEDAGTCQEPDAAGASCGADAGTCAYAKNGCGPEDTLQCLAPYEKVVGVEKVCSDDGCSVATTSFGSSQVAVPTFLFGVGAVAFLMDRRRRRRTNA
jgi:hypothetical protein